MNLHEIRSQWMAYKPVKGVAFGLNDSVYVKSGSKSGFGAVISLEAVEPEPQYIVELSNGNDVQLPQSNLLPATDQNIGYPLGELQRWYSSQCDGDWEHQYGIQIGTLDNPGWIVKINLEGTPLAATPFTPIHRVESSKEWIDCKVEEGEFRGAGGPHMLGVIIEVFMQWTRSIGREHT